MTERGSDEIGGEVDRTRAELGETLDAVHERLSPRRWLDDGTEYLRRRGAGDIVRGVARVAREHPLPFALMLGGAVWLYFAVSYSSEGKGSDTEPVGVARAMTAFSRSGPAVRGSATGATGEAPLAVSPDA